MLSAPSFRTTIAHMRHALALLGVALLLTGCFDVDTSIDLSRDGSGTLEIEYRIDEELYQLGVFDDSDLALPVPLSRSDFEKVGKNIPGLSLRRYRARENAGVVTVKARISFDTTDSLSLWYAGDTTSIALNEVSGQTEWSQVIVPGSGSDGAVALALAESLAGYTVKYQLVTPSPIVRSSAGSVGSNGRSITMEVSLTEIVTATAAIRWVVAW